MIRRAAVEKRIQIQTRESRRHMPGKLKSFFLLPLLLILNTASSGAQSLDVKITVATLAPPRLRVEGTRAGGAKSWSFLNVYAGAIGLGERVENLVVKEMGGREVAVRKLAPGEFEAAADAAAFSYDLRLNPPKNASDAAHVSWLTPERGFLMLGDLLPVPLRAAKVRLTLPPGWSVATTEAVNSKGEYEIADAGQSVFLIGRDLRNNSARRGAMEYATVTTGEWAFDDEDVARTAGNILREYEEMTGGVPLKRARVLLSPFPETAPAQSWSAETRGGTVILLSGRLPSKTFALSRLDSTLAHELLHLWVPNGLSLDGEYDWFYEGFTLYQSARRSLRRGQLTFQDYLNALGRSYDNYKAAGVAHKVSLVEASRRRWTLAPSFVYDKGMLVAFLYDLTLTQRTGGKNSLDDAYRTLFRRHGSKAAREDGTRAALNVLGGMGGMKDFVTVYVESPAEIDLAAQVAPFGLRLESIGGRTRVTVSDSLSQSQRDLLRNLGYNGDAHAVPRRTRE
jgi:predicted metalloprotease with PDZ domain